MLAPIFDTLGESWLRRHASEPSEARPRPGFASLADFADGRSSAAPHVESVPRYRGPWTAPPSRPRRGVSERLSELVGRAGEAQPQTQRFGLADTASASKASARRALLNALADTPLGRTVGRVLDLHQDESGGLSSSAWSKAVPLLSPRVNAGTRTVGLTLVWRF